MSYFNVSHLLYHLLFRSKNLVEMYGKTLDDLDSWFCFLSCFLSSVSLNLSSDQSEWSATETSNFISKRSVRFSAVPYGKFHSTERAVYISE
jgi:hypothetical protein